MYVTQCYRLVRLRYINRQGIEKCFSKDITNLITNHGQPSDYKRPAAAMSNLLNPSPITVSSVLCGVESPVADSPSNADTVNTPVNILLNFIIDFTCVDIKWIRLWLCLCESQMTHVRALPLWISNGSCNGFTCVNLRFFRSVLCLCESQMVQARARMHKMLCSIIQS